MNRSEIIKRLNSVIGEDTAAEDKEAIIEAVEAINSLPIPIQNYKGKSVWDYSNKDWLMEIIDKAIEAYGSRNYFDVNSELHDCNGFIEEVTELITFCVSWLEATGYAETTRQKYQRIVNEHNKRDGCFRNMGVWHTAIQ